MKCVMLMFDSLNRHMLPNYGCDWTHAPNFKRLAHKAVTFERSYCCSMPCMPARRDLHTGRPNFLHCSWGPLEPFDDSMPAMLSKAGVYTHLATDHYHYFEDGGCTYHNRYSSWECFRGQEGDFWIGQVKDPVIPANINTKSQRQDWVNREHVRSDEQYSQSQTVAAGLRFIDMNHDQDRWFLQIECFDPHEPFTCDRRYRDLYPRDYDGPLFDWPAYAPVKETPEQVQEIRLNYAALLSKCDASLGDVLDAFDRYNLWEDTMLVVWTDHGFMLGEHQCWAKGWMPMYEEVAHTPFFVWDPRFKKAGERRESLVQPAIDLGPTLLRYFGVEPTKDMRGHDLAPVVEKDAKVRDAAIFGYFGQGVNVTDGRYTYLGSPVPGTRYARYTLMPTNMLGYAQGLDKATLGEPWSFTKNLPTLRLGHYQHKDIQREPLLFDLMNDPQQQTPLQDETVKQQMREYMARLMKDYDAPAESYECMGLTHTMAK